MKTLRGLLVFAFVGGVMAAAAYFIPHLCKMGLLEWVRSSGLPGLVVYWLLYVTTTVLMVPPSFLNAGAGLMLGPLWGILLVYPALIAAGLISFWFSRSLARAWVAQRVAASPKFAAIDQAIARGGFRIVLLLRMSPVSPFAFLSYSLGLTRVRLRDYFFGSLVGALPGAALYVYLGSALSSLRDLSAHPAGAAHGIHRLLFWLGLAATGAAFVIVNRLAHQELNRTLAGRADVQSASA